MIGNGHTDQGHTKTKDHDTRMDDITREHNARMAKLDERHQANMKKIDDEFKRGQRLVLGVFFVFLAVVVGFSWYDATHDSYVEHVVHEAKDAEQADGPESTSQKKTIEGSRESAQQEGPRVK